ncbi:MAG TPA: alpha-amylase family glycosyl hydrolase [Herpetosiphonaceae bacterium]
MFSETIQDGSHIVGTAEVELGFSLDSGMLTLLRRPGGANCICVGGADATVDVQLTQGWLGEKAFARYLGHSIAEEDGAVVLVIQIGLAMLRLHDTYRLTGTLVARSISVENTGLTEQQMHWVRLVIPYARVGSATDGRFEAPSNSFRPRLSIETVAKFRRGAPPGRELAPAVRRNRPFENAPDRGPGLLALHSTAEQENLLCWYWSTSQTAWPDIHGNNEALSLGHEIELAGWLPAGATLSGGTQYLMFVSGTWFEAMQAFNRTWQIVGLRPAWDAPGWVRQAAIYETHAGLYGGFAGLADALPSIRALGCDTLNLMPVWAYDNRSGKPWDNNWAVSGSPYAIRDFEQLEPTLGTADELRALIGRAHQLGMRVLCDLVLQGCARDARYVTENPGWFCRNERGRLVSSHGWNDTYSFDWANPALQAFFVDWTTRFAQEYDIDGWRVDAPHRKEPNWDRRLTRPAYTTSFGVLTLIDEVRARLKAFKPEAALLCELYGPLFAPNHDFAYDYLAHLLFFHAGLGAITPYELGEWLEDHFLALPRGVARVCFTETHDTRDINPIADAVRGSRLSRMLLAGLVGCGFVPMLWMGQEENQQPFLRHLLGLRVEYRTLRDGDRFFNQVPCDAPQVWTVLRSFEDERLIVAMNISPHKRTAILSLPVDRLNLSDGEYHLYDALSERVICERETDTWRPEELLRVPMTFDPYAALYIQVRPGPPPAAPSALDVAAPEAEG